LPFRGIFAQNLVQNAQGVIKLFLMGWGSLVSYLLARCIWRRKKRTVFQKKIMVNLESFPPAVPYVEFHEILQKGKERRGGPEMMAALAP
jgi:hypothetical protein